MKNLLKFVNADIKPLTESGLISVLYVYTRFLCQQRSKHPFLKFKEKYNHYICDLLPSKSPEVLLEKKEFLGQLQSHLRSRLDTIINAVEPRYIILLTETCVSRRVLADCETDNFLETFWPFISSLDLSNERFLADLAFSGAILNGNLKPSRFRRCRRCKNFFYQYTEKEKTYCSIRCGNADRQVKYRNKLKR